MTTHTAPAHVRWMVRRDMSEVLAAFAGLAGPPSEEDVLRLLRRRNAIGMVAEEGDRVVGAMVYRLEPRALVLELLAVAPDRRRRGVGRLLLRKVAGKLSAHRRPAASFVVRETNEAAHLWLRACGWRATGVEPDAFESPAEDGYRFRTTAPPAAEELPRD